MGARSSLLMAHGDGFAWSLLDAAPDATVIVADNGEIVYANDQAFELFGFDPADLLGRPVEDLLPDALREAHRAHRARFRATPSVRSMGVGLKLWARQKDGTEFPVEISLSPLQLGTDTFAVAAVRDITDRLRIEKQLQSSRDALREAEQVVAVSNDRERIARNLHDTVIQRLFGEGLNLQAALSGVDDPERTRARIAGHHRRARRDDQGAPVGDLLAPGGQPGPGRPARPPRSPSPPTPPPALGFEPRLQFDGPIESIDEAIAEQLVPVMREALSNVAQHAQRLSGSGGGGGVRRGATDRDRRRRRRPRAGDRRTGNHQHGRAGPRARRHVHHRDPGLRRDRRWSGKCPSERGSGA